MNKSIKRVVIFGLGELAELAHYYFTHDSDYEVVAFCIDEIYREKDVFLDLPVINFESIEKQFPSLNHKMFIAIGYSNLNQNRIRKYVEAKNKGYELASYISTKNSSWSDFQVGENTFIMENNTIMPFAKVGHNVLIWVGNIIAHHMIIEDHVTITSHCAIGGNVLIKSRSFIGLNSTIRNGITIEEDVVIAANSNVVKNASKGFVYIGNPAKKTTTKSKDIKL